MRTPRDLDRYATARAVAVWLRRKADEIERAGSVAPLVKVDLEVSNWNPDWAK